MKQAGFIKKSKNLVYITKKGKAYTDKVQKKVQNVTVTKFAAASAVAIGAAVVDTYLMNKN